MSTEVAKKLDIVIGGYSSAGKRDVNQDAFAVKKPSSYSEKKFKGIVACIADGVSCSNNGQQASQTSVTQFINDYYCTNESWDVKKSASKVLNSLNAWLYHHSKDDARHNGLITTFSTIVFKATTAHLFHVGDSRIYRYREGVLAQLTQDHCRYTHGDNSVLVRALGMDCHVDIDYCSITLRQGDIFLLSSDGIHDVISNKVLVEHIACQEDKDVTAKLLETLSETICKDALNHDSADNLSCLLLKVGQLPNSDINDIFKSLRQLVIPPAMLVGNTIDTFKVDQILHQGARSHVYLATEKISNKRVVLKMPSLNYIDDQAYLDGFYKEQWVGQRLNHPSIMSIQPRIEKSPFLYHICEYIEGITLRQWMHENPEPAFDIVINIIKKVVDAVRVFQRSAMVHRDLKPENIIISKNNHITLIDFGTVKVSGLDEISKLIEEVPLGAADYIAPEYLYKGETSILSDLFSIGVITYELLSGGLPYQENNMQSLQKAVNTDWTYRDMQPFRTAIPKHLNGVLHKATHPVLDKRYSSMSEFINELQRVGSRSELGLNKTPFIERHPLKFWKLLSLSLLTIAIIELFMLLNNN
jgi:serine/threonine protein kinase/serine/threonine protein phosphatase PrpC